MKMKKKPIECIPYALLLQYIFIIYLKASP